VEVAPGVEALCHNSEIPGLEAQGRNRPTGEDALGVLPIGTEHEFKIIRMNENEKKIGLSLKAVGEEKERQRLKAYQNQAEAATQGFEGASSGVEDGNSEEDR
jgi:small subunit ribosomal protein S1